MANTETYVLIGLNIRHSDNYT